MKDGLDTNPDRWPDVSRVFSEAATLSRFDGYTFTFNCSRRRTADLTYLIQ